MGLLADSKRSSKISRDPNNTKWTKNTDSFGQKIMRSQGWEPGQYLGAQDAAQSDSYTAANASYIRVSLKDDMKGLGFNKAKEDQVTGLDVFSDLLSRLNGKSEAEVEDGRQARMAVQTNIYVEQRYGPMRFVRGGLLVGDTVKGLDDEGSEATSSEDAGEEKEKKSKKRKASADDDTAEDTESTKKKQRKEERKSKRNSTETSDASETMSDDDKKAKKKTKKSKKSKGEDTSMEDAPSTMSAAEAAKAEKKERKREKKEKKEKKRRREEAQESGGEGLVSASTSALPSAVDSGTSTPTRTGTSTPQGSRNFVRSRFIAQKKQALLDTKALNQIFMVKA